MAKSQKTKRRQLAKLIESRSQTGFPTVSKPLTIAPDDYQEEILTPEEIQKRVTDRIREQDTVIIPRLTEGGRDLPPMWKKYIRNRTKTRDLSIEEQAERLQQRFGKEK